jgi:hypothetical protein
VYMGSLTPCRVWGAPFRQSSSACRLESIDPVTFLDQGGRACHNKSNRDAGSICACRPSPDWGSRVKNLATNSWFSRRQHPANKDVSAAAGPGPAAARGTAYYHVCRVRSGHASEQPVSDGHHQTDRGARHCLVLVVGGLSTGLAPAGTSMWLAGT